MNKLSLILKSGAVVVAVALFGTVGLLFDNFVRGAATQMLQITLSDISKGAEVAVKDATETLDGVVANNASICTPEFLQGVRQTLQRSIYVRQILVENNQGARYCSGLEVDFDYRVLSEELNIPGRNETLAAVRLLGSDLNLLRITYQADDNRTISAFVHFAPILATGQLPGISSWGDVLIVEFTDGTNLLLRGDRTDFDFLSPTNDHIFAEALAGDVPVRTLGSVPIGKVREQYRYMYLGVFAIALVGLSVGLFFVLRRLGRPKLSKDNLEYAISSGEIVPYYQPVIDFSSGKIVGSEVLAHWVKPDGRILPPEDFEPYAGAANLSISMTLSLLSQVAKDMEGVWALVPDMSVSINLGSTNFEDLQIADDVKKMFSAEEGFGQNLIFEIATGSDFKRGDPRLKALAGLRKLGCKIALVGASAMVSDLKYAQLLRAGMIKIDAEFLRDKGTDAGSAAALKELVVAGHEKQIDFVGQGVETKQQATLLRQAGVHLAQGSLIAPALSGANFFDMLTRMNSSEISETEAQKIEAGISKAAAA